MIKKLQQFDPSAFTLTEYNIYRNIVDLWSRYIMWTRSLFFSKAGDQPNLEAVQNRVMQIPTEFYSTLRIFYGDRLAQQISNLLQIYFIIKSHLMDAMIAGDQNAVDEYTRQLYASAGELSELFAQAPYWDAEQWRSLLYQDIRMSIEEFRSLLAGDYEREISVYERLLLNGVDIGNYMASGIVESIG